MINNRAGTVYGYQDDPFSVNSEELMKHFVENVYSIRSDLMRTALHRLKDVEKECDYPSTYNIRVEDYKKMYDRNPIGRKVVVIKPSYSWQVFPQIYEDEDASITTEWEREFSELGRSLQAEGNAEGHFENPEEGHPVWEYLARADKLSGIGHFGVILLGLDDGKPLDEPVDGFLDPDPTTTYSGPVFVNNQRKKRKLLYLSVFGEDSIFAESVIYETNQYSPRYRKPKYYHLDLGDTDSSSYTTAGRESKSVKVHWSRVVHVADNMDASEIISVPRQRPVWNNLLDLMKVYGGDAEGFWKACVMQLFFSTHPQLGGDVTIDESTFKDRMWDMQNGLQRWGILKGMGVNPVAPQVVDPTAHINVQIEAICIQLDIPKRIFMGSERGQLASGQDVGEWNDQVRARRSGYVIPRIIVPFFNRLIQVGVLPVPKQPLKAVFPDPETQTPQEKATVAVTRVDAMAKYIKGQVNQLMDPMDFLTRELEVPEEDAEGILERAMERVEEEEAEREQSAQAELEKLKEEQGQQQVLPGQEPEEEEEDEEDEETPSVQNVAVDNLEDSFVDNAFCPTGKGGGTDPTCSPGGGTMTSRLLGIKPGMTKAEKAKAIGKSVLTAANAMPTFARTVAVEAGASPRVAKMAYIAATIGDFALPGIPAGSAAVIALSSAKKPRASYDAARSVIRQLRGQTTNVYRDDMVLNSKDVEKRMKRLIQLAQESGDEEQWFLYYFAAIDEGVDETEAASLATKAMEVVDNAFCPTGIGGGQDPTCSPGSSKSSIAKASAVRVASEIQRYSEEHNEPQLAAALGGCCSLDDNEPVDVTTEINGKLHGIELKTMTVGKNNKITMKRSAMDRKKRWERKNKAVAHTVVFDDTEVFNAKGPGKHDFSKRRIFYRRGYGSFRVNSMHEIKDFDQLKSVMSKRKNQIPKSAGGTRKG